MRLEVYIAELLYRYHCVVVPEFGAFLANSTSAVLDKNEGTFYPPKKILSFNQQLTKNDGLLVSHIANTKNLPYEALLEEIKEVTKQWNKKLASDTSLYLEGIGKLWLGKEERILFEPEERTNYLTASFGLSPFAARPVIRETLKEEVSEMEKAVPITFTPEKRSTSFGTSWLKYAAIGLLLLATGASGYQLYQQNLQKQLVVEQNFEAQVTKHIQEATFFDSAPLELPALNLKLEKKAVGPQHHIIAGAFRYKVNADKKIAQLKAQGYNPSYLGTNAFGLHQVTYDSFSDSQEALRYLKSIKASVSADAWMLSER